MSDRPVTAWLLTASPVAWFTFAVSVIGLAANFGYSHASLRAEGDAIRYQVQRNREEAMERIKLVEGTHTGIFNSLAAIHSIKSDVEVIKAQIQFINDAVRRIEQQGKRQQR